MNTPPVTNKDARIPECTDIDSFLKRQKADFYVLKFYFSYRLFFRLILTVKKTH